MSCYTVPAAVIEYFPDPWNFCCFVLTFYVYHVYSSFVTCIDNNNRFWTLGFRRLHCTTCRWRCHGGCYCDVTFCVVDSELSVWLHSGCVSIGCHSCAKVQVSSVSLWMPLWRHCCAIVLSVWRHSGCQSIGCHSSAMPNVSMVSMFIKKLFFLLKYINEQVQVTTNVCNNRPDAKNPPGVLGNTHLNPTIKPTPKNGPFSH